jgi:predicted DNA-binding WGR domain protein
MTTRMFEFSAGKSSKFWSITLDSRSHTVSFGQLGTSGQTLTMEFTSAAEAQRSHDRLVAEKLKKGYIEKSGADASVAGQSGSTSNTQRGAVTAGDYAVRREIELDVAAFSYVATRRAASTPLVPAEPFNLEDCLARLRTQVRVRAYDGSRDYSRAIPARLLAPQEAEFWLTAMTLEGSHNEPLATFAEDLSKRSFRGELPASLQLGGHHLSPFAVQCLANLLSADELRELLLNPNSGQGGRTLRAGFRRFVLPHLDDAALAQWRGALKTLWDASAWPSDFHRVPDPIFYFGALLGLHDEVRVLVEAWPDDLYAAASWDHTHYHRPQEVVYGVGAAEQVAQHFRRLKLPTNSREDILTFLAITDLSALDVIVHSIATTGKKEQAEELFAACARVHAPEAARHVLELALSSKATKAAREWLENNLDEAIVGLMPVAAGTGKLAEAASEFFNSVKRRGQAARIEAHCAAVESHVAARLRAKILDVIEVQLPVLTRDATPTWWTEALARSPVKQSKPITWVLPTDLPPLAVGERALGPEHVAELLAALQASTLENPHPLLRTLREHVARDRLDAFGWKLFASWLAEGAPPKEKWAFIAAGFLGGERTVLQLAPLVRTWPGESQHQRAVLGLEVLRIIGSDTALMQINGIAQKVKFKGLKERAIQCIDAIAISRGMTRSQLEDRIVPDCGLDERGERAFDFGPRQFRFMLGPDLKPMIRYPDRTAKSDLPKPGAKDDAAQAEPARAAWKLLKKQIAAVAKIQAVRLEQAMVTGRRWSGEEFDKLFVHHPLMVHLARMLVWGSYAPSGAVVATFRVAEDQTLADVTDQQFMLPREASVGVLHPLQVVDQAHVLQRWGQLFGDYEIIPPFAQLGRPAYHLTDAQLAANEVTHFAARGQLPAQSLVFGLEKLGWQRGVPDAGWVGEHSKQFYGADVTAVITYAEGFSVGALDGAGDQRIERVFFIQGLYTPRMYPDHRDALRLAEVDPIALSEVLADCDLLLSKATT